MHGFDDKRKKVVFFRKKRYVLFGSSEKSYTFALAFGKQRGYLRGDSLESAMILENIPYRQAVQRVE